MKAGEVLVPISVGELYDKLSILEIKAERITDASKRVAVEQELALLSEVRAKLEPVDPAIPPLAAELKAINLALWDIEDEIRERDRQGDFGPAFVALAQAVYRTNDRRAELKRKINEIAGSRIAEQKSYAPY